MIVQISEYRAGVYLTDVDAITHPTRYLHLKTGCARYPPSVFCAIDGRRRVCLSKEAVRLQKNEWLSVGGARFKKFDDLSLTLMISFRKRSSDLTVNCNSRSTLSLE